MELKHQELRKRLDILGYEFPLPSGAISLVTSLLEDLLKTTESLKVAKHEIGLLLEEKACWELDTEPFRCDNSKLLAENNKLHIELLQEREKFELQLADLRNRLRTKKTEHKLLREKYSELVTRSKDLASKKDAAGMAEKSKKPFISTVRSGGLLSDYVHESRLHFEPSKCKCSCHQPKPTDVYAEIEKLQTQVMNQDDLIEEHRKHLDARDREIQRLNQLFTGGRPASALGKDCCYRSVHNLAEDVELLQREKILLQQKLSDTQSKERDAIKQAMRLKHKNEKLERELGDIEKVAMNVESEANLSVLDKEKENCSLREKLEQSVKRISELERAFRNSNLGHNDADNSTKSALKLANHEKKLLMKQLSEIRVSEQLLKQEIDHVKNKYLKMKTKMKFIGADKPIDEDEVHHVRAERDYIDRVNSAKSVQFQELEHYKQLLQEKDEQVTALRKDVSNLKIQLKLRPSTTSITSSENKASDAMAVKASIHRIERERDVARNEVQRLQAEKESLEQAMNRAAENQLAQETRMNATIQQLRDKVSHLENQKTELMVAQTPSQTTIALLKDENRDLKMKVHNVEHELSEMRITYNQLRMLQQQQEKALTDQQNKVYAYENQLDKADYQLNSLGSNKHMSQQMINSLKEEVSLLKASMAVLELEKDRISNELDQKTQQVHSKEAELQTSKAEALEIQRTLCAMKENYNTATSNVMQKDGTLRSVANEAEQLRKEVVCLQRYKDNHAIENCRLSNELADTRSDLEITKRKLAESEKTADGLKSQIQHYVSEVKRAEELLMEKERERDEMLETYKSLSHETFALEETNQTLAVEKAETKKMLQEVEARNSGLELQMQLREDEIRSYEHQIGELSSTILRLEDQANALATEKCHLQNDLDAVRELCNKLDKQKDKLEAELAEHSSIRQQLDRENEKLRQELSTVQSGDTAAVSGLQDLLATSRNEIEQHRMTAHQLNQEVLKLRGKVEDLQEKMTSEQMKAEQSEALAHEYNVQLQELRRLLTDDRFSQVRLREEASRPLKTGAKENKSLEKAGRSKLSHRKPKRIPLKRMQPERDAKKTPIDTHDEDIIRINCTLEETRRHRKREEEVAESLQLSFEYYSSDVGGRCRESIDKKETSSSSTSTNPISRPELRKVKERIEVPKNWKVTKYRRAKRRNASKTSNGVATSPPTADEKTLSDNCHYEKFKLKLKNSELSDSSSVLSTMSTTRAKKPRRRIHRSLTTIAKESEIFRSLPVVFEPRDGLAEMKTSTPKPVAGPSTSANSPPAKPAYDTSHLRQPPPFVHPHSLAGSSKGNFSSSVSSIMVPRKGPNDSGVIIVNI